ncbi:hypothetical protein SAMN05421831_10916 [Allopseudospirillum japonicum]|uniref:DUF2066 domain-containing protein n=1 Tax=Allopseudospirillum japonicum TaxID=64971 RepID=A0A1H6T2N6_9GAMM|nr:DUF2066 domain-containing protein [Allopseudospirillum japonicum]SEI74318.1 hypothetical protein SAMN05421831_10916 [Allopseudospirillum japonicum]
MLVRLILGLTVCFSTHFIAPQIHARSVENLYESLVKVPDTKESTRQQVAREALAITWVRISGHPQVLENQQIQASLAQASAWIEYFAYQTTEKQPPFELKLTFQQERMQTLLQQAGLPLWGQERPQVVAWIVLQGQQGRYFITPDTNPALSEWILAQAQERGLPWLLPTPDLGVQGLQVADIWGGFREPLEAMRRPYQADILVSARVMPDLQGDAWTAQWRLLLAHTELNFQQQAPELGKLLSQGVHEVANRLANLYSFRLLPADAQAQPLHLQVTGVEQISDYAHLSSYLQQLPLVQEVNLLALENGYARLQLQLGTPDLGKFNQILQLDSQLVPELSADFSSEQQNSADNKDKSHLIYYHWRPKP